jgi:hypothetical protein
MSMLHASPDVPPGKLNVVFKGGSWMRGFFVLSFGATTAIALLMAAFKMLEAQPDQAFGLLRSWGPSFLIGAMALWLFSSLLERAVDKGLQILREYFSATAAAQEKSADATKESAVALQALATGVQRIADKDDRQMQEMQTLTAFTGAQTEKMYSRMGELHDKFDLFSAQILTEVKRKP